MDARLPGIGGLPPGTHPVGEKESLFERFPWLYAFCRDHLFQDDTPRITRALWPSGAPGEGSVLLELGCGPGFYARRLAGDLPQLRVTGIDLSGKQLERARALATADGLGNCSFERGDVYDLDRPDASAGALVASRLFTILADRETALEEMHRVLEPGGRCFVAEPCSALRASVPLHAMWMLAGALTFLGDKPRAYQEPARVSVMTGGEFDALIASQPWKDVRRWQSGRYRYAVCEKGGG
ncbi:methyltransferase domain-containing protein [Rubrobacter marinus]|uniref:Methyltransferase domain-containing protein n=2 Tax=Rubrobacter marinus TaxID=2653852 RepID=A0A6G8Q2E0_9ACTN|nr:methyltransferase domain-containing protein [Rubrobacter marinus]